MNTIPYWNAKPNGATVTITKSLIKKSQLQNQWPTKVKGSFRKAIDKRVKLQNQDQQN